MDLSPSSQVADPADRQLFTSSAQRRLVSVCLVTLMAAQLLYHFSGLEPARYLSWASFLAAVLVAITRLGLREYLLIAAGMAMAGVLYRAGRMDALAAGLDLGTMLSAFILLLGLLREGAVASPSVLAVGDYLTRQPPQRRYAAVHAAGHVFGLLLNMGALTLLAPLIQRGVRAGNYPPDGALIRERRQLSALLRGFSWIVAWSPTTVTNAVLVSIIAGVDAVRLAIFGLGLTGIMLIVGWLEDYFTWRATMARFRASGRRPAPVAPVPAAAFRNLGLVCVAMILLPATIIWMSGAQIVHALMLSAPVVTVIWLLVQHRHAGFLAAGSSTWQAIKATADHTVPNTIRESATMGLSGILGSSVAAVAPVHDIAEIMAHQHLHPALLLTALPVLMALGAQVALSPIMTAVLLGAIFGSLPVLPADPTLIALSLACGWALAVESSPNVGAALLLSRTTGHAATTLTWRWNGGYVALVVLGVGIYFWVLTSV